MFLGLIVGTLFLLAAGFWFAAQRDNRLQRRIEPHISGTAAKGGRARRQEARAATRTRFIDAVETAFANVKQFKRLERLIERADLPLRPGELLTISTGCAVALGIVCSTAGTAALVTLVLMASASPSRSSTSRGRLAAGCGGSRTSCRTC